MKRGTLLFLMLAALGCEHEGGGDIEEVDTDVCASGFMWAGGNEEDPRMHPGRDCIDCHTRSEEGPSFTLAGTVFPDWREADDCLGVAGVTVEITDATKGVYRTTTNAAGNFYLREPLTAPYSARLLYEGRERRMLEMQTVGACNSCHTPTGDNGAPGRMLAP